MIENIKLPPTDGQAKDTGMAMAFLALLGAVFTGETVYVRLALAVLLADMLFPKLFLIPARLWFGLAFVMGFVVSNALLAAVFFLVVTPVGLVRRALGKDAMQRRGWKAGSGSVFAAEEHPYTADDLAHPY